jgi:curved DNA-binding protein CbpA
MSSTPRVDDGLARLLAEQVRTAATGIFSATSGKLKRLFCLREGRIIFVASNMIEEQFEEVLVKEKLLGPGKRIEARAQAANEKKKLLPYLKERKIIEPAVLEQALEAHIRKLVESCLKSTDTEYSFDNGEPNLASELTVSLSCVPLILEYALNHPAPVDQIRVRIGPPNMKPEITEEAGGMLEGLELPKTVRAMVDASDGTRSIAGLVSNSKAKPEECLRSLYGLLMLGILAPAKEKDQSARTVRRDVLTRDECMARLQRAVDTNHYELLGVERAATTDEVRDAYYYLARRYHPDRFRTGTLHDLFDKMEAFFTRVTGAYNTLFDSELRERYDEELAELGAGTKKDEPEVDAKYLAKQNYARARLMIEKKKLQDAVQFLENAIELDGSQADYHRELGELLTLNPRRRDDAEQHLHKAIELNPAAAANYFSLGQLYRKSGRDEEAAKMFREVLSWDPGHAGAQSQLVELGQGEASEKGRFGRLFKS